MIQNIIILVILIACALYVARRMYSSFRNSDKGGGCGCSCSDCGSSISSTCNPNRTDPDSK